MREFDVTSEGIKPSAPNYLTQIIFQRHGEHENSELTEESIKDQAEVAKKFLEELFKSQPLEDIKNIDFLFLASPTADENEFKRSVATTDIAMQVIKLAFEQIDPSKDHIINLAKNLSFKQKVKESGHLEGSRLLSDNTGYADILAAKYGKDTDEFWEAFDIDNDAEKRIKLNSEGPYDIADRGLKFAKVIKRYADWYHKTKPNIKLIIWCGTHYDIISNLTKRDFLGYNKTDAVYVDNCGGMSLSFDENNAVTVNINGAEYPYTLPELPKVEKHI